MEYDADIFDAVEFGDIETVKQYWTKDINIDYQDMLGVNLIMLAAKYNHKEIVNHLLLLHPNLYLKDKNGATVFQIAKRLKDQTIFKALVEYSKKHYHN